MIKNLTPYYLSRIIFSIAFGLLLFIIGMSMWMAIVCGGLILAFFLWAPHRGRYSVHPEFGITAMRRDERAQIINDKAARNAFVVIIITIGAIAGFFGSMGTFNISISVLIIVLMIGVLTYFVSDIWLRKSQS